MDGVRSDRREGTSPKRTPRPDGDAQTREERQDLVGIGAVAARVGVSGRTLRYYEEVGLLHPTDHRPGGSRRYCEADVERVWRIRDLQGLMGFNLVEIRAVISAEDRLDVLRDRYRSTVGRDDRRRLLEEGVRALEDLRAQVAAKVAGLEEFLAELDAKVSRHRQSLASWAAEDGGAVDRTG